jgi:hypothetical protein
MRARATIPSIRGRGGGRGGEGNSRGNTPASARSSSPIPSPSRSASESPPPISDTESDETGEVADGSHESKDGETPRIFTSSKFLSGWSGVEPPPQKSAHQPQRYSWMEITTDNVKIFPKGDPIFKFFIGTSFPFDASEGSTESKDDAETAPKKPRTYIGCPKLRIQMLEGGTTTDVELVYVRDTCLWQAYVEFETANIKSGIFSLCLGKSLMSSFSASDVKLSCFLDVASKTATTTTGAARLGLSGSRPSGLVVVVYGDDVC